MVFTAKAIVLKILTIVTKTKTTVMFMPVKRTLRTAQTNMIKNAQKRAFFLPISG